VYSPCTENPQEIQTIYLCTASTTMPAIWATARGHGERPPSFHVCSRTPSVCEPYSRTRRGTHKPERYRLAVPSVPFPPQESDSAKTCRHEIAHVSHRYIRQLSATVVPTTCSLWKRRHPLPTSTGINFASLGRKGCTIMPDGYISRPPRGKRFFMSLDGTGDGHCRDDCVHF